MITLLNKIGAWLKYYFWTLPTAKPPKPEPIRVKAEQVLDDYMVIVYHKQKINLRKSEYEAWKANSRYDKRATAQKFAKMEADGVIRWEMINDKWVCVRNLNYERRAEKAKEKR